VWGKDRTEAVNRTRRALDEYRVSGPKTTIGFHRAVMDNGKFLAGDLSTSFLTEEYPDGRYTDMTDDLRESAAIAAALDKFTRERKITTGGRDVTHQQVSGWLMRHRRENLRYFGGSR